MCPHSSRTNGVRIVTVAVIAALTVSLTAAAVSAAPLGSEFTYQGSLTDGGSPVDGTADFRFTLWNDAASMDPNDAVGAAVLVGPVSVVDGLFTVDINFGPAAFNGDERWMEIEVRSPSGPGTFTTLTPRQLLTAAPYARTAVEALNVTGIDGHSLDAADANPADALFVDNDGKVGIGTSTPAQALHVVGSGAIPGVLESSSTGGTRIQFHNTDVDYRYEVGTSGSASSVPNSLVFVDRTAGGFRRMMIDSLGNAAIGLLEPTSNRLTIGGNVLSTDNGGGSDTRITAERVGGASIGIESGTTAGRIALSDHPLRLLINGDEKLRVDTAGNVGIGTNSPGTALSFSNVDEPKIAYWEDNNPANRFYGVDMATGGLVRHWVGTSGQFQIGHFDNADDTFIERMRVDAATNGGRLNLYDTAGVSRVNAQATNNGGQVKTRNAAGQDRAQMYVNSSDAGNIYTFGPSGNTNVSITHLAGFPDHGFVGVVDSANTRQACMFVNENGEGEVECDVMQIFGGSDIAEPFNVSNHDDDFASDDVQPGMVVSIDASRPGELRLSSRAYDNAVAGVISGAGGVKPGMTLQQPGTIADGKHPVAMTGRVWCWVDADAGGPVHPGDLLTTSDTPGHAMKAVDRDRAFGTSIGKAMTALERGRGLVLVLVNLQ